MRNISKVLRKTLNVTDFHADEGEPKDVVVEIERTTIKKPFLGGYRHKINGIEFHNAAAQTVPLPRASSGIERYCRDTQTVEVRSRVQQTFNDTSTQMTGVYA